MILELIGIILACFASYFFGWVRGYKASKNTFLHKTAIDFLRRPQ